MNESSSTPTCKDWFAASPSKSSMLMTFPRGAKKRSSADCIACDSLCVCSRCVGAMGAPWSEADCGAAAENVRAEGYTLYGGDEAG